MYGGRPTVNVLLYFLLLLYYVYQMFVKIPAKIQKIFEYILLPNP